MKRTWMMLVIMGLTGVTSAQRAGRVAIAYVKEERIVEADSAGNLLRSIPLTFKGPVSRVAIDRSGDEIAVVARTFGRGEFGGDLYLWTVEGRVWKKLTRGPYVFKKSEKGHREVYDDPAFSPDGHTIAFVIHYESLYDDNDVVDAAGPAALLDTRNASVRVIKATAESAMQEPTGPPWFANSPRWSPAGDRLLLDFESGYSVIDLKSGRLRMMETKPEDAVDTFAVNWLDESHVLILAYSPDGSQIPSPHVMHVDTGQLTDVPARYKALPGKVVDCNADLAVFEVSGNREVIGASRWQLPKPGVFGLAPTFAARM